MAQFVVAGGRIMLAGGRALLLGSTAVSGGSGGSAPALSTVTGLNGWWDAGSTVSPTTAKAGTVNLSASGTSTPTPHLAGTLAGLTGIQGPSNYTVQWPSVDHNSGWSAAGIPVSSSPAGDFSVYLVWSRPNQIQNGTAPTTAAAPLIALNGTTVLQMTGQGSGSDTLQLFPGGTVSSGGTLELRHTHSVRLCLSASSGVDVWLDGTKVISGAAKQISLSGSVTVSFLQGAECHFHEAGTWPRYLSPADHAQLSLCMARWPVGPRKAANVVLIGQSNAGNLYSNYVLFPVVSKVVSYYTGQIASNLVTGNPGSLFSGRGIYYGTGAAGTANSAGFLNNLGDSNPAGWPLGTDGQTFAAWVAGLSADVRSGIAAVAWYWSESDSARSYAEKTTYEAAMRRAFALIRSTLGTTAARLPIGVIDALPFGGSDGGCQMHREVMADLIADSTQSVFLMLAQSGDAIGQGDTWSASTGAESGAGNAAHRDQAGSQLYAIRWGIPLARAVLSADAAASSSDVVTALPAGLPAIGGPKIASAHYEGTAYAATGSVLVTVTHDGGTALATPLRAASGVGWTVMDGGTTAAPGSLVGATACAVVSATQLRITLARTLANASAATVFYAYGQMLDASNYAVIGQGNAVTDNWASIALPSGWQTGSDLGPTYQPNMPLQATLYGVPLS